MRRRIPVARCSAGSSPEAAASGSPARLLGTWCLGLADRVTASALPAWPGISTPTGRRWCASLVPCSLLLGRRRAGHHRLGAAAGAPATRVPPLAALRVSPRRGRRWCADLDGPGLVAVARPRCSGGPPDRAGFSAP